MELNEFKKYLNKCVLYTQFDDNEKCLDSLFNTMDLFAKVNTTPKIKNKLNNILLDSNKSLLKTYTTMIKEIEKHD